MNIYYDTTVTIKDGETLREAVYNFFTSPVEEETKVMVTRF